MYLITKQISLVGGLRKGCRKVENTGFYLTFEQKSIIMYAYLNENVFVLSAQYGISAFKERPRKSFFAMPRVSCSLLRLYAYAHAKARRFFCRLFFDRKSVFYLSTPGRVPEKRKVFPSAKIKDPCSSVDNFALRTTLRGLFVEQ